MHNVVETGGEIGGPCVRQNRVVLSASYFFGLLKAAEVTENVGIFRLAPFN